MKNNKLVCIIGRTCSGKDSLSGDAIIKANNDIIYRFSRKDGDIRPLDISCNPFSLLVSYTTRPKRHGESISAHKFISMDKYMKEYIYKEKIAETTINKNTYFVLYDQVKEMWNNYTIPVYIIDPNGLESLIKTELIR